MMRFGLVLAAIAVLLSAAPVVAHGAEPVGVWLTEKGDARVKVTRCSSGICGVVVWLREQIKEALHHSVRGLTPGRQRRL